MYKSKCFVCYYDDEHEGCCSGTCKNYSDFKLDKKKLIEINKEGTKFEYWKPVYGYDKYEVSNLGNVRNNRTLKILDQSILSSGHPIVHLTRNYGFGQKTIKQVGKMVADAFFEEDHKNLFVNHIDGNLRNNNLENLELCTMKELKEKKQKLREK